MVTILANLNTGYNNFDSNKPITIKEIIAISYQKNFEKAIYIKFQFLIKNNTQEYKNALLS